MNAAAFPPVVHRLAALALLLALAAAAFALLAMPLIDRYTGLRADIAGQRALLGRFEAFAANKPAAEATAEQARALMRSGLFLDGETEALRAANLQAIVTDVAGKSGVRLSSSRGLPPQEQDGLRLIGVQAEFEADMRQVQAMLAAFAARRPVLFVQSVQMSPLAARRRDAEELKLRFGIFAAVAPSAVPVAAGDRPADDEAQVRP
jgi:hypothetical protein